MADRLVQAFTNAVNAVTQARFFGTYEFEVVSGDSKQADLKPTDRELGLPDLVSVPTYTSAGGESVTYAPGSKVLVTFVNGSPGRPVVVSQDASKPVTEYELSVGGTVKIDASGSITITGASVKVVGSTIQLGEGVALPVMRATDLVICGPFSGSGVVGSPGGVTSV